MAEAPAPPASDPSPQPGPEPSGLSFAELGLAPAVLAAVAEVGYEAPSPIQAQAIPPLLAGKDLLGQAQTGTGKTAAFALPLLSRLDPQGGLQLLVLTPTRELAIQVAEAMQTYARHIPGFRILPVYGGQDIGTQLRGLKRGVHAVVGTPGRIQDHLRRGTLNLDGVTALVLDEADEMLRMGFLEEVEAILEHTPPGRQIALFSATLPETIRRVARRHLREPVEVLVASKTTTVATVSQRYWPVVGVHKLDALTRILEVEDFDAMLVFVRTRGATAELAEKLEARGFACAALSGDMSQTLRERVIERLRGGQLDIVVATDVAARGLDLERISHVVNYDIPHDVEAYVHRIGRTGRAGRGGVAILFVSPREQHALRMIERATRQPIERMHLPTKEDITGRRIAQFKETIGTTLDEQDLDFLSELVEEIEKERETSAVRIAAALAYLVQKDRPLIPDLVAEPPAPALTAKKPRPEWRDEAAVPKRERREERPVPAGRGVVREMARYRLEVGADHGALPKNIVGAIANEAGIDGRSITRLDIRDTFSLVDLPAGLSTATLRHLAQVRICGRVIRLRRLPDAPGPRKTKG
ncbi:MAG TPA: DEAD/DEAH box helicase [Thermoanaerobaculia bacterium]|nr:DEAD/DEAH box helicase [Thermoanaerobaculia bacterium]